MRILSLYIFRNFFGPLFLGWIVFTFLLIIDKIFSLVNLLVVKGVNPVAVGKLFIVLLPILLASIISFARLSEDNEITAIRASGIQLHWFITPFILLSLVFSFGLMRYNQTVLPNSQRYFRELYQNILVEKPYIRLEEGTFLVLDQYRIYIDYKDKNNLLHKVLIYKFDDNNLPLRINAKTGKCWTNYQEDLIFELYDGKLQQYAKKSPDKLIDTTFKKYLLSIPLTQTMNKVKDISRTLREMTGKELKSEIKQYNNLASARMAVEYYMRNSIAFACFVFTIVGIPLGIQIKHKSRAIAFAVSIIIVIIYYLCLIIGITLGDRNMLRASLGMWLPDVTVGLIGIYLYYRMSRI